MPEIIRRGDKTTHGGTVIEGSQADICHGKPIAFVGHRVSCPLCKGIFPIVEGVTTMTFYGKGVAVAGMKTACGAALIPSQFTDVVEWGNSFNRAESQPSARQVAAAEGMPQRGSETSEAGDEGIYDLFFVVKNLSTGEVATGTPYRITLDDGSKYTGITDENGFTQKVKADSPRTATLEVPYYDDCSAHATDESDACGC